MGCCNESRQRPRQFKENPDINGQFYESPNQLTGVTKGLQKNTSPQIGTTEIKNIDDMGKLPLMKRRKTKGVPYNNIKDEEDDESPHNNDIKNMQVNNDSNRPTFSEHHNNVRIYNKNECENMLERRSKQFLDMSNSDGCRSSLTKSFNSNIGENLCGENFLDNDYKGVMAVNRANDYNKFKYRGNNQRRYN